jgi:hypothetical protein
MVITRFSPISSQPLKSMKWEAAGSESHDFTGAYRNPFDQTTDQAPPR